jgi:hypothetical protein
MGGAVVGFFLLLGLEAEEEGISFSISLEASLKEDVSFEETLFSRPLPETNLRTWSSFQVDSSHTVVCVGEGGGGRGGGREEIDVGVRE